MKTLSFLHMIVTKNFGDFNILLSQLNVSYSISNAEKIRQAQLVFH